MQERLLQAYLQRSVVGANAILHPLNIAVSRIQPWPGSLCAVCVADYGRRIDVAESRQLSAFVSDVTDVEQKISRQLALNSEVELLDVGTSLVRILRAS